MIDLKRIKNKILQKENFYFFIIILVTFFLDRFTKNIIISDFSENSYYINNIKSFHSIILDQGIVPLFILEEIVNEWIDDNS